jgi:hypothetical protein
MFGPKRNEVTGEWRKLHNEEFNDLYPSPNSSGDKKSRRMGWAGHVARMGRIEVYKGFWLGNLREIDQLRDPGVDGRMDLEEVECGGIDWIELAQVRDR